MRLASVFGLFLLFPPLPGHGGKTRAQRLTWMAHGGPPQGMVNHPYSPQDRRAFLSHLDGQIESLEKLPDLSAESLRDHLETNVNGQAFSVAQLVAHKSLFTALGRPKRSLPALAEKLRESGAGGEILARRLEDLATWLPERNSPQGRSTFRVLAQARRLRSPFGKKLSFENRRVRKWLSLVFDGGGPGAAAAPGGVYAVNRSLGALNQYDPTFWALGLAAGKKPRGTYLCGSLCIVALARKVLPRSKQARETPFEEILEIAHDLGPSIGIPTYEIVNGYVPPSRLKLLLEAFLARRKSGRKVFHWGIRDRAKRRGVHIPYSALQRMESGESDLIFNFSFFKNLRRADRARFGKRLGGHYFLLSGVVGPVAPGQPLRVVFQDSAYNEVPATLIPLTWNEFGIKTFQIFFDFQKYAPRPRIHLVDSILEVRNP